MMDWRPVVGYEDLYEISEHGLVRTLTARGRWPVGTIRRGCLGGGRGEPKYLFMSLSRDGRVKFKYVHQMAATAFVGPCPRGQEVNHDDGDTTNNHYANLVYATPKGNKEHAVSHKLYASGERHPGAKLTSTNVVELRRLKASGWTDAELANKFGIKKKSVWGIVARNTWFHIPGERPVLDNRLVGEDVPSARLTEDYVRAIRALSTCGWSSPKLAQAFRVHRHSIRNILDRKTWAHV